MTTTDALLCSETVFLSVTASSKKQLLEHIAERASELFDLDVGELLENLHARERLGTTGVGKGVGIPHARVSNIEDVHGIFAQLKSPIDFEALDDQPVDLVFMLIAPEESGDAHLRALAKVARLLRNTDTREKLRACETVDQVLEIVNR